jgi:hypothetical protein
MSRFLPSADVFSFLHAFLGSVTEGTVDAPMPTTLRSPVRRHGVLAFALLKSALPW